MSCTMGLYRMFVSVYYSRKNFMFMGLALALLTMVYFYLPFKMHQQPGTHYLNPRINKEVVKPHAGFHPKMEGAADSTSVNIKDLNLKAIPEFITERKKCPACFGQDLCPEIDSGAIKILVPEDDGDVLKMKGVYNGFWKGNPVVIKRLNKPEEYAKVDAFLCRNASMEPDCDVSKAILSPNGLVQQEKAFHPEFLREAWKIMHDRPDKLPVAACITEDAINLLSEEFDSNKDKKLSPEEKAHFFMSLVFNPESLFLEFAKKEGLKIHFPEILGRCGRIVVTEHAGFPLAYYLDRPFKERADLAMMLLGMIFFLQNFSSKWSLVFSDFNFDNFYVKDNNLYIVDAEDMLVTDTETFPEPRQSDKTICNHQCMEKFALRLFDYKYVRREDVCPLAPRVTEQAMYALACERILSYLPEHRDMSPFKGLLHDPPEEVGHFLENALKECVTEPVPDGRISSIDVLSEMLEKFTDYGNYMYNGGNSWGGAMTERPDEEQQPDVAAQNAVLPPAAANVQQTQQPQSQQPQGAQPQGVQPQQPRGVQPQGVQPQQPQGVQPQGVQPQEPQGVQPQGVQPQQPQGVQPQGVHSQQPPGVQPQGVQPQQPPGVQPQGAQPPGVQPQGAQPPGVQPQGAQPPGVQPQGAQPPGVQPQGVQTQQPPGAQEQVQRQNAPQQPVNGQAQPSQQPVPAAVQANSPVHQEQK